MELSHPSSGMSCRAAISFRSKVPGVDGYPLQIPVGSAALNCLMSEAVLFNCLAVLTGADLLLHLAR